MIEVSLPISFTQSVFQTYHSVAHNLRLIFFAQYLMKSSVIFLIPEITDGLIRNRLSVVGRRHAVRRTRYGCEIKTMPIELKIVND